MELQINKPQILLEDEREQEGFDPEEVLTIAMDLCECMLECGAEIHRVEDTAERICRAYGAERVEIFAMTSLITATIVMADDRKSTQVRRVYGSANELYKIEKLNALSRTICRDTPKPSRVKEQIRSIQRKQTYPRLLKYVGGFIGTVGFCLFFGGNLYDALLCSIVGMVVCLLDFNRPKYINQIVYTVFVSAVASFLSWLFTSLCAGYIEVHLSTINISIIMLLIPGLALGNAVRDLLCGELVSGAVKMLQCILIAAAIATGFTCVLLFFGGDTSTYSSVPDPLCMIVMGGGGALGFSVLFGVHPKRLVYATIAGMICTSAYMVVDEMVPVAGFLGLFLASLAGGAACTLYAEVLARILKTPATVFLIPGLIPMVPGGSLYYTMAFLVQGDQSVAAGKGIDTLCVCLGISTGIVIMSVLGQIWRNTVESAARKKMQRKATKLQDT
ncbi:MAG: threonine/serine exporter family protein [Clostridia bacterium]|nr:threonine/serine exporter family protein [Clostridia bacterium]